MYKYSFHINIKYSLCIILSLLITFLSSCSKEESENNISPVLLLKTDSIYISSDTSLAEGRQIILGVKANSNGGENLCNLLIISNDSLRLYDYGFNSTQIDKDIKIFKNSDSIQNISIIIRNKAGLSKSIILKIAKNGSLYQPVIYFPEIILGAQQNSSTGSFCSLQNGMVYSLSNAFLNQELIDLLYYYNSTDHNTIGSPGANISGVYSGNNAPEFWAVRNTTYFSRTTLNIPISSFDNSLNDSLIIANIFSNGGRKIKLLLPGQIWAFQTKDGKFGLIKIKEVDGLETGTVKFAIKLQP